MESHARDVEFCLDTVSQKISLISNHSLQLSGFQNSVELIQKYLQPSVFYHSNQKALKFMFDHILKYLQLIEKDSKSWRKRLNQEQKENLLINVSKISVIAEGLEIASKFDENDLSFLPESDERMIALKNITTTTQTKDPDELRIELKKSLFNINVGKIALHETSSYQASCFKNFIVGWRFFYYSKIAKDQVDRISTLICCKSKTQDILDYNIFYQSKLLVSKIKLLIPWSLNETIYIPRSLDFSLETNQNYINNKTNPEFFLNQNNNPTKYISITVCSQFPVKNLFKIDKSDYREYDTLLINLRGCAFAYDNTILFRRFEINLSKTLDCPLFSINYRIGAENPFPAALQDVWESYCWLVNNSYSDFRINPKKIIIVGQSSGANLSCGLIQKAILSGFRVPDGLLLIFPAIDVTLSCPKSITLSLEDFTLPTCFFRSMVDFYIPKGFSANNPYITATYASAEVLGKFPRTEIMVPLSDPLSISTFRFAEKLLMSGCKVHIYEYPGLIHVCLSNPKFLQDCYAIIKNLSDSL
jgi:alpha/beta hydrolase fold